MARDITEGRSTRSIAVELGIGAGNIWQNTCIHYDVAIDGMPFISAISDQRPYVRQTAPFRKQQFDNQAEPGEQSLTGWWLRSQSSFHYGAGIKFYGPAQDESLRFQFNKSKGVDIWEKGQVTLLNDTTQVSTSSVSTSVAKVITANDGTNDIFFIADGPDIKKVSISGDTPTATTYTLTTSPHTLDFLAIATNGTKYFASDNARIHTGNLGLS